MHRIEISYKIDARIKGRTEKLRSLGFNVDDVRLVEVYTISREFSHDQLVQLGEQLVNPVMQQFVIDKATHGDFGFAIEVGFLPGVTDNVGSTARQIVEDFFKVNFASEEGVYSSKLFLFKGNLSKEEMHKLGETLANPLIQRISVKTKEEYSDKGMGIVVPKVKLHEFPKAEEVDLEVSDEELARIGKEGIADKQTGQRRGPLALDLDYLHAIQAYFRGKGRKPTDLEVESLAQTWSEHCKHTIFAASLDKDVPDGLYKTYIKAATNKIREKKGDKDICLSVFVDNSGAIVFDDKYLVTHKVETHNSPSALDPFGGAITGIVGVNRDTIGFGLGAKPALNYYGYCFADPRANPKLYRGKNKANPIIPPRQIMSGVVDGVNAGGNCSGIPTPQGWCYFEPRFCGKPLVFVGTVGIMPRELNGKKLYEKSAKPGDRIVVIGGKVGKDGIHGATFSSEAMDSGSPATAVQIGDPITQKKLSDAIVKEARDLGLYNSITDNGAGGISCSVAEMARECNGCHVYLDAVPLKYPGMAPWEIWISESQERMTLAIPQNKLDEFMDLMRRREVESTVIGEFNDSGKCVVEYKGKKIMDIELEFLHEGTPKKQLKTKRMPPVIIENSAEFSCPSDLNRALVELLARPNICSKEFISTQYDHTVQGGHVIGPVQGKGRVQGMSSLTKVVLDSPKAVGLSQGVYPSYSDLDAYYMAAAGIDTAIRGLISIGIPLDKIALLDNFCWCSSNEPERLWQLKRAAKACYDYATKFQTPFISGKDSMFNDFKGYDENDNPVKVSVPPTLLISSMGVIDDVKKAVTMDAKFEGDLVYVVGETNSTETGASEYLASFGQIGSNIPKLNASAAKKRYKKMSKAIKKELIASCYAVNYGGLGIALAKVAIAGRLGMHISLKLKKDVRHDYYLFSESQGRFVVTVNPSNKESFEKIMAGEFEFIGTVHGNRFVVMSTDPDWNNGVVGGKPPSTELVNVSVDEMEHSYKLTFKRY
ncbi:MAG: AIR synthase-related protein [Candidatus Micrarchaeota archaeon]